MKAKYLISCTTKEIPESRYPGLISHIGGVAADNSRWKISQREAVFCIRQNIFGFYIIQNGLRYDLEVKEDESGVFITTAYESRHSLLLYALPDCPG